MEYCLSILYVAMDELGMIWCMDAFMERRYKDWKFWVTFTISMARRRIKTIGSTVGRDLWIH